MAMRGLPKAVVFLLCLAFLAQASMSVDEHVKQSLLNFYTKLSGGIPPADPSFGWNTTSDPCIWTGVSCTPSYTVVRVILEGLLLDGTLDVNSICAVESLLALSITNNSVGGEIPDDFSNCKHLTHLYLSDNKLSGALPESLSQLNNLKRLDISNNYLSGQLPDLIRISGLVMFLAQNNDLVGQIPQFNFANLQQFNVSYNNLSGPIPYLGGHFNATSFMGNSLLCGKPLDRACPPCPPPEDGTSKSGSD